MTRRIEKVNSLLKEVISEVIKRDLKNHTLPVLLTVTGVDTSRDLRNAKVYISLIEEDKEKKEAIIEELQKHAGQITYIASKKVVMRYFPALTFKLDNSIDRYMEIDSLLKKVEPQNDSD